MTFPTVVAATAYATSGAVTSWTPFTGVNVAKGSIVVVSAHDGDPDLTTTSTGWGVLGEVHDTSGTFRATSTVFYKTRNGTDDLVVTSSDSEAMTAVLLRVSGGGKVSGAATIISSNPPSLNIGVVRDVLWVTAMTADSAGTAGAPSGYGNKIQAVGDTGQPSTHLAYRTNRASSEDPGSWSGDPSGNPANAAWTIALWAARRSTRAGGIV